MRPFTNLIPFEEAKRILMENVKPIERVEEIDILHSLHRVLAEDVISPINVPPFQGQRKMAMQSVHKIHLVREHTIQKS